jgi:hypothetical protein
MQALKYIKQKYAFKRESAQQSITNNFYLLKNESNDFLLYVCKIFKEAELFTINTNMQFSNQPTNRSN